MMARRFKNSVGKLNFCLVAISFFLTAAILLPGMGLAASFAVNSTADSHDINPGDGVAADHPNPDSARCTLRAAIEEANSLPGPDTITIPSDISPIALQLGALRVEDNATRILGLFGLPTIDGVNNPLNTPTIVLASDSNTICGLTIIRSRGDGLVVTGAYNQLGGTEAGQHNVFLNNGLDYSSGGAVCLQGQSARGNHVIGNYIGMYGNGTLVDGNRSGVRLTGGASGNFIGGAAPGAGNLISGNRSYGVIIADLAHDNIIAGNTIGPNSGGISGPGNESGGLLVTTGAFSNLIGGDSLRAGNLISANGGDGVRLSGPAVRFNVINWNRIGVDASASLSLGNRGHGVAIVDGASYNYIGKSEIEPGNIISGNDSSGVMISGASTAYNELKGNLIGLDITGYVGIPNGMSCGDGVLIDKGAHYNLIGGPSSTERNAISANVRYGVHLKGTGTDHNIVSGNFIGTSGLANGSKPNYAGVVIDEGARENTIGGDTENAGNIISGNRAGSFPYGSGVLIFGEGTAYNRVLGNWIGLDIEGNRSLRNNVGIVIGGGASHNLIGDTGPAARNVISGNGSGSETSGLAAGIHLYGTDTKYNRVTGNVIGLAADSNSTVVNYGHGIGLYAGASENEIGGHMPEQGNIITGNRGAGVYIDGSPTRANLIRYNRIYDNDSLGIKIDNAAQDGLTPPVIVRAATDSVSGTGSVPGGTVDIYLAAPDPSGAGEGARLIGSTEADASGNFAAAVSGIAGGDTVTAMAIDQWANSSEFALNMEAGGSSAVDDGEDLLPHVFALGQNFPNPFNPSTTICFSVARRTHVRLTVYNALGQTVRALANRDFYPGEYRVSWDGRDNRDRPVASGMYFYRIDSEYFSETRKMLLLK